MPCLEISATGRDPTLGRQVGRYLVESGSLLRKFLHATVGLTGIEESLVGTVTCSKVLTRLWITGCLVRELLHATGGLDCRSKPRRYLVAVPKYQINGG